jgi:hypothetical protein
MDCFVAEPVIGRRLAPTRWLLAMTKNNASYRLSRRSFVQ